MNKDILKKLQDTELEIASIVFEICGKYNLRCSLVGGSAIGAVRHKGFIPWDDDIDIAMPRPDYERFVQICKTELPEKYFLQCFETEKNCAFIFGKVRKNGTYLPEEYSEHLPMHQGVWVDIFVYDKVSNFAAERTKDLDKLTFYRNLLIVKAGFKLPRNRDSFTQKLAFQIARLATLFFSTSWLQEKCTKIMTSHENDSSDYIFPYGGAYSPEKELMPITLFDNLIDIQFEDRTFKLTSEYDFYLTSLFGDYMTPPSPEKRGSNHYLDESKIII